MIELTELRDIRALLPPSFDVVTEIAVEAMPASDPTLVPLTQRQRDQIADRIAAVLSQRKRIGIARRLRCRELATELENKHRLRAPSIDFVSTGLSLGK